MITVELSKASCNFGSPDEMSRSVGGDHPWTYIADIPSLEWAVDKWADIVVTKSKLLNIKYHIKIYDDYIE